MRVERRMKARGVTIRRDESLAHGKTPRVHRFRLKSCDTAPISSSLRRAEFRVLEPLH